MILSSTNQTDAPKLWVFLLLEVHHVILFRVHYINYFGKDH